MNKLSKVSEGYLKIFSWFVILCGFSILSMLVAIDSLILLTKILIAFCLLLAAYLSLEKVFNKSVFSKKIWKVFYKQKWLHWYAKPINGLIAFSIVNLVTLFLRGILEVHWNFQHQEHSALEFMSACKGGWQLLIYQVLGLINIYSLVIWCVVHNFGGLMIDFVKGDSDKVLQSFVWQLSIFIALGTVGIILLEFYKPNLVLAQERFFDFSSSICEK